MKSANIINRIIVKSIIFVIGLTMGVFSANIFYKLIFSPVDRNEIRPLLENVKDYKPPKIENCKPNPLVLVVEVDKDRNIFLNMEKLGTLDNFTQLKNNLSWIFEERENNGVYEENSLKVIKEIIIIPKDTLKDKDLFNLVDAVEQSGANPILIAWDEEQVKIRGGGGGSGFEY